MENQDKTRDELNNELESLRRRVSELEQSEAKLMGTERLLRESEERFRLLYENAPLGYQSLDENGYFLEVNHAWLETLGYSREEVIGKWFGDFLAPGYQEHFKINFPKFKAAGEIHWVEFEMIRKDGSQVSVAFDGQIGRDEQGRFRQTHCILHDISEIKRSQDALKESEERYKAVVDNIEVGISLLNSKMEIVEVNRAMKRYFPQVRPACGQICYEHYNDPPRSEPCSYCPCVLTLQDGEAHEAITETPAGSEIRYYHLVSSPIKDSDGRVQFVIELTEDVTDRKRIEEALQDSEERLRLALEATHIGIWDWDVKTDQWYASPTYYTMLGYEPNTGLADRREWLERVHPDDRALVNDKIQDVLTRDFKGYQYEARLRHADGAYRWQHVQGMSVKRDEDGKVTRMLGIRMDITERKRAEEALRASEEKFRTLADWTYDWEYWVDPMGRLNYMSPTCKRVTGFGPEEFADDPGLLTRIVHPTDRETYEQHVQHIHKRDAHIEEAPMEFRIIALDGTVHWIEHVCRPVYSADGSHIGRRVSNRDVTERKETQEALRESEEQYRAVFENAGMGIDLLDRDGRLVKVNKALSNMLGYAEEELRRLTFLDVTHPEDREISKGNLKALMEGEVDSYRLEKRYVKKDGNVVWADLWTTTIRDENGEHAGMVAVIDDITDRKRAEEALRRLNRELRAVSNCNQSVLRALDEQTLVNDICRIICDEAGYRLAWVGYAENDDAKTISPVAWAGFDSGYIADTKLSWADDTERGRGPAGTVIRSGETVCVQDFTTDQRMVPWRESALQRGYRSGIALPLKDESAKVFGALLIYHSEPYAMTPDEIRLMEELAADLAFGINTLRTRAEREQAEEALRESEKRVRRKLDAILSPETDIEALELSDIIDSEKIQKLMNEFYRLTNVGIGIIDLHGNVLVGTGWQDICTKFHRVNPESCQLCIESDLELSREVPVGTFKQYRCKNNMWDIVTPIMLSDQHVGNIFMGQFLFDDEIPEYEIFRQQADRHGFKEAEYLAALDRVPRWSHQKVDAAMSFYTAFASMIGNLSYSNIKLANALEERKRAEEVAVEQIRFQQILMDAIPIPVFFKCRDGKYLGCNEAFSEFLGKPKMEIMGKSVFELNPKHLADIYYTKDIELLTGGGIQTYESRIRYADGTEHDVIFYKSTFLDVDGTVGGLIGVILDITEQKSLQRQLLQAQKMEAVGALAGGMAHDFNNILTAVQGFSELLLIEMDEKASGYSDLQRIRDAGRRGADLVQNLLAFSRKAEIKPRPINLNHEVARIEKLLRRTIPKMIEIELHLERDLAAVNADPGQMGQVLMNLAVNAEQAMPDGGNLTISTTNISLDEEYCRSYHETQPGRYVMLTVEDTGHGMDKETLEHIFEPFFTTKDVGKGTGLGLAMAYGILRQHGGHITCYSEPGIGATFKIYLPAITEAETERRAEPEQVPPRGGTETILLVDDEDFIRHLGQTFLSRAGYTVLTAASGPEAVQLYLREGERISLLILDLIMPEMGGDKCLEEILAINPDAKIVISSGAAVEGKKKETIESGARGFVNKPFQLRDMLKTVRHVLDSE